jgi:predicted site-specific integrase-resolvase
VLLPECAPDGCDYLTNAQAAMAFGVAPSTVSGWVRAGYLTAAGARGRRAVYRLADVAEAEYQARQAAIRTSGSDKRVRRIRAA